MAKSSPSANALEDRVDLRLGRCLLLVGRSVGHLDEDVARAPALGQVLGFSRLEDLVDFFLVIFHPGIDGRRRQVEHVVSEPIATESNEANGGRRFLALVAGERLVVADPHPSANQIAHTGRDELLTLHDLEFGRAAVGKLTDDPIVGFVVELLGLVIDDRQHPDRVVDEAQTAAQRRAVDRERHVSPPGDQLVVELVFRNRNP